jgi:uncharacterized membrane protein
MYRSKSCMLLVVALFVFPQFFSVDAQWVMAARAARNRIQRMTQRSSNGGYDVAIVLLEAASTAVYDKTLKSLQARSDIQITTTDAKNGRIEIEKGYQVVGFQINALGDKLTQLVIASNVSDQGQPGSTSMVVESVLHVCKEVDVRCTLEQTER